MPCVPCKAIGGLGGGTDVPGDGGSGLLREPLASLYLLPTCQVLSTVPRRRLTHSPCGPKPQGTRSGLLSPGHGQGLSPGEKGGLLEPSCTLPPWPGPGAPKPLWMIWWRPVGGRGLDSAASSPGLSPPGPNPSPGVGWGGDPQGQTPHQEAWQPQGPGHRPPKWTDGRPRTSRRPTRAYTGWPPQNRALGWLAAGWPVAQGGDGVCERGSCWSSPCIPTRAQWPSLQGILPASSSHGPAPLCTCRSPGQRGDAVGPKSTAGRRQPGLEPRSVESLQALPTPRPQGKERLRPTFPAEGPSHHPAPRPRSLRPQLPGGSSGQGEIVQAEPQPPYRSTDVVRSAWRPRPSPQPSWSLCCVFRGESSPGAILSSSVRAGEGPGKGPGKPAPFPETALESPRGPFA